MSTVLVPVPDRDFDPTEVAASWQTVTQAGNAYAQMRQSPEFQNPVSGPRGPGHWMDGRYSASPSSPFSTRL
jgi:hypothetical protein